MPLRAPTCALELQGSAHLGCAPLQQNPATNSGVPPFWARVHRVRPWSRGSQRGLKVSNKCCDTSMEVSLRSHPVHDYPFKSYSRSENNRKHRYLFFLSELLGEVSNFEGGSTLYRSSTTKNLRFLSLIFTESQNKQICSYLWTSDICVSVH